MDGKKVYVLTKNVMKDDGETLDFVNVCGVVSSMREAKAWAAGYDHNAFETEVDAELQRDGLDSFEL